MDLFISSTNSIIFYHYLRHYTFESIGLVLYQFLMKCLIVNFLSCEKKRTLAVDTLMERRIRFCIDKTATALILDTLPNDYNIGCKYFS